MNASNQIKIVSLSLIVLLVAKLFYSFLIQKKTAVDSFTLQITKTSQSESVMSSVLRTNNKLSSSIHHTNFRRQLFTLYDKMTETESNFNFPIHFYNDVSSTMDKVISIPF
jgi:hypothetical protein